MRRISRIESAIRSFSWRMCDAYKPPWRAATDANVAISTVDAYVPGT
jgi:hypothetical protein